MPFYNMFDNCANKDIKRKFAWLPTNDLNGNHIWLKFYWEYGEWWEFGFFALRGAKKEFPTKQYFWDTIKYRIASLY